MESCAFIANCIRPEPNDRAQTHGVLGQVAHLLAKSTGIQGRGGTLGEGLNSSPRSVPSVCLPRSHCEQASIRVLEEVMLDLRVLKVTSENACFYGFSVVK